MRRSAPWLVALFLIACQGDPVGEGSGGGAGASGAGGTASGGGAGTGAGAGTGGGGVAGPGPHGALPSGYCCTSDQDCRYRTCTDFGGVKLCSDTCTNDDSTCNAAPNMKCNATSGQCEPAGTPSCIPAAQFVAGTVPLGGCCIATGDGHAGEECQGNLCMAFGALENPFICTHACDVPKDCPPKYECNSFTRFCWPIATTYTCE